MTNLLDTITIRGGHGSEAAVARLAQLDSAAVPAGELLVAEVDGELRAALSLADDTIVADPFSRTLELVELLRVHARRLSAGSERPRRPLLERLRPRPAQL